MNVILYVLGDYAGDGVVVGSMIPTDCSALRALAILKTFEIRPVGLLSHVLAGLKFMLFHASMKSMSFRPWYHRI